MLKDRLKTATNEYFGNWFTGNIVPNEKHGDWDCKLTKRILFLNVKICTVTMNRLMILEPDYVNWQQRNELPRFLFETKTCYICE